MATRIILGPAGAGKTSRLLDAAAAELSAGPEGAGGVVFLTPSAAGADLARRRLTERCGGALLGARFETFVGLSVRVLAALGGRAGRAADAGLQEMLASGVIERAAGELGPLARVAPAPGFPRAVAEFTAELAASGVSPEELSLAAGGIGDEIPPGAAEHLGGVCRDLALLARGLFDALSQGGFFTRETVTAAALAALQGTEDPRAVPGEVILVDGFGRFTPAEADLLAAMAGRSREMLIALTWGRGGERPFEEAERTRRELTVKMDGCTEEILPPAGASRSAALEHLERSIFRPEAKRAASGSESVEVIGAAGEEAECRLVARRILELAESGYAFGEMAVFLRTPEAYLAPLADECRRLGVPLDAPRATPTAASAGPVHLITGWLAALFVPERDVDLLGCLRGVLGERDLWAARSAAAMWPGAGLDEADALAGSAGKAAGEAIRRAAGEIRRLRTEFDPEGLASRDGMPPGAYAAAAEAVSKALQLPDPGADFSRIRDRLEGAAAAELLRAVRECAEAHELAGVERMTWTVFSRRLAGLLGARRSGARLAPAGAVMARSVFEARTPPVRVAFVMGLADGRFPARRREGPFISDREREALSSALGRPLVPRHLTADEEDLLFYIAATRPTEKLILTRPATDEDGNEALASVFLEETASLFEDASAWHAGQAVDEVVPELSRLRTASEATARLAVDLSGRAKPKKEARNVLSRAAALYAALGSSLPGLDLASASPRLSPRFGQVADPTALEWLKARASRPLSPTGLEDFTQCAFLHLARRLLGLEREPEPGFTPLSEGNAMHVALRAALEAAAGRPLTEVDAEVLVRAGEAALDAFVAAELGREALSGAGRARWDLLRRRIGRVIRHEVELAAGTPFVPKLFEVAFGPDAEAPLVIDGGELGELALTGRIDRVDVDDSEPEPRAVAIDYKRGTVRAPGGELMAAMRAAQVPVYALALQRALGMRAAGSLLYSTATLDRRGIVAEGAGAAGTKSSDALSEQEIRELLSAGEESIRSAARWMRAGEITVLPADVGRCRGCEAADVCRYDRWEWWGSGVRRAAAGEGRP